MNLRSGYFRENICENIFKGCGDQLWSKYQVDSQGIKIYPVDDGENFKDWVSYLCSVEARKRDAPALVLIKLSYLGGISPE